MRLNQSFIEDINNTLEDSIFTLNDFKLSYPGSGPTYIKILFAHIPEYELSLYETTEKRERTVSETFNFGNKVTHHEKIEKSCIRMTPGRYKLIDTIEINEFDELLLHIKNWCQFIKNDLRAKSPKYDPLEELRKKFEEELENIIDGPNGYFNNDEILKINEKFEALYNKIEELK